MMVYVHVPFCLSKCPYCDFNSYAGAEALLPDYLRALGREMENWRGFSPGPASSLYLGGGTPSLLSASRIGDIIDAVARNFGLAEKAEVTVEVNPATWNGSAMREATARGVNRFSLGVQALDDAVLGTLGRPHDAAAARRAVREALDGSARSVSADLIYGVPGQDAAVWNADLRELLSIGVHHVSAYALTVEDDTPLAERLARGEIILPPEAETERLYLDTCELLQQRGYRHYEISNFAQQGHACRHNRGYWERRPYLGFGAGAHSFAGGLRWWAPDGLEEYIDGVEQGTLHYGVEVLAPEAVRGEEIMLGLRTDRGVPPEYVETATEILGIWVQEGLIRSEGDNMKLTPRGMLLSNELISTLLP